MCHRRQQDKRWAYNLSCNVAADNYSVLGCEPSCFCGMVHSMCTSSVDWLSNTYNFLLFLCRFTCENVVRVLRSNKDSVMAMLEAFVHDPLINWRLLNTTTDAVDAGNTPTADSSKCSNCACYVFIPCLALESSMYSLEYACCVSALIMLRRKDTLLDTLACIVAFQ